MNTVHLDSAERRAVRNRLSRARGQLEAVIRQLDQDEACLQVLPQMIAANKAVDRATYAMILAAMQACSQQPDALAESQQIEKIFLSLA